MFPSLSEKRGAPSQALCQRPRRAPVSPKTSSPTVSPWSPSPILLAPVPQMRQAVLAPGSLHFLSLSLEGTLPDGRTDPNLASSRVCSGIPFLRCSLTKMFKITTKHPGGATRETRAVVRGGLTQESGDGLLIPLNGSRQHDLGPAAPLPGPGPSLDLPSLPPVTPVRLA